VNIGHFALPLLII